MRWMWIDRVTELQPRHKLVAVKNVSLAEEHLHDHFPAEPARGLLASPVMPASLIVEGCAQTGGILVGHAEEFKHKVILAKVILREGILIEFQEILQKESLHPSKVSLAKEILLTSPSKATRFRCSGRELCRRICRRWFPRKPRGIPWFPSGSWWRSRSLGLMIHGWIRG